MALVSEEIVVTTEVEEICALGSAITSVTVSTVDCLVDGTTRAAGDFETNITVGAADDFDEEISVATEAEAAIHGGACTFETAVGAELVTVVSVGIIDTLNAGCSNRFETGSEALE